jgi:L-ascorbate metabolism protein UlaG (beta-lactamase superfamily)
MAGTITWLGHAAFEVVSPGGTDLLIDPFLTKNPATPTERKDLTRYHPTHPGDALAWRPSR